MTTVIPVSTVPESEIETRYAVMGMMKRMKTPTKTMTYGSASAPRPVKSMVAPMLRPSNRMVLAVKQKHVTVKTLQHSSQVRMPIPARHAGVSVLPISTFGVRIQYEKVQVPLKMQADTVFCAKIGQVTVSFLWSLLVAAFLHSFRISH